MDISKTRHGLRLAQHGIVVSELRTTPGPTHSVFDVLAGLLNLFSPRGAVGVLGFAGGGIMAPLQALNFSAPLAAVDLDASAYALFCRYCPAWQRQVEWTQADAVVWLQQSRRRFGVLLEDLSIPVAGDVIKPEVCWTRLPGLMRRRLRPGGFAIFNLLPGAGNQWPPEYVRLLRAFGATREVRFAAYENRVVVAGAALPAAAELSRALRGELRRIGSRQARQISVRRV